jgi:hypothetical protein
MFARVLNRGQRFATIVPRNGLRMTPTNMKAQQALIAALPSSQAFSTLLKKAPNTLDSRRTFFTKSKVESSMPGVPGAVVEEKKEETLSDIIGSYGWYPFLGLGTFALLSKEIYIIDAQTMILGNFLILSFATYVGFADKMSASIDAENKAFIEKNEAKWEFGVALQKELIESEKNWITRVPVIEKVKDEYNKSTVALYKAKSKQLEISLANATLKKLNAIVTQEREEARLKAEALSQESAAYAREMMANATKAQKDQSVALAIKDIGVGMRDMSKEPVNQFFIDFIAKWEKDNA